MEDINITFADIPNNDNWIEEYAKCYPIRYVERIKYRVSYAMKTLEETPIGEKICFEGSCPSGSTYDDFLVWDGTSATREHIAYKAFRHGFKNADSAWCKRVQDVKYDIGAAMMTTGFHKV